MCRQCNNDAPTADESYDSFWSDIVEDEDGNLDREKVKLELHGYRHLLREVPLVYETVTGCMSKAHYWAHDVISEYDRQCEETVDQAQAELLEDLLWEYEGTPEEPVVRGAVMLMVRRLGLERAFEAVQESTRRINEYREKRDAEAS